MTIPITNLNILRVLLQAERNLTGLQRNMRNNALRWKIMAEGESVPITVIAGFMDSAALAYKARLEWIDTFQDDNPVEFPRVVTMWNKLGGTAGEFGDVISPMETVANNLGSQTKTTYAELITICDFIIGEINAPLSLWPE
jgi:hypothetical protein